MPEPNFLNEIPFTRRSTSCPCVTVAILSLVDVNDLSAIMNYASTRMYADNTNLTFVACSMPELQHDMKVDLRYRKIPKISPGACIFQRPFLRGLYSEGLSMEG